MQRCEGCGGLHVSAMKTLDEVLLFFYCHDCGRTIMFERTEEEQK
jgi:hypothetical protein